jgi:hypothetical protein
MDRSYQNDVEKTERIRATILSDDCSIDDRMECDGDYVEPTAVDSECADDDDDCC